MAESEDPNNIEEQPENEPEIPRRYNFDSLEEYLATSAKIADEGRNSEAIAIMREADRAFPKSALVHYNLGVAIFMTLREDLSHLEVWEDLADQEELAEECLLQFQTAIELDPQMAPAYANLGMVLALRGRNKDAMNALKRALELDPELPGVQEELDIVREELEPVDEEEGSDNNIKLP